MKLSDLLILVSPSLLALHEVTGHGAFLYLFGVWIVLIGLMISAILGFLLIMYLTDNTSNIHKALRGKPTKVGKIALGVVINVGILTYLLYNSFFGLSTLFIMLMIPTYLMLTVITKYRNGDWA
jgi:hypothetical protein